MVFCPVKGNLHEVLCYGGWSCIIVCVCAFGVFIVGKWINDRKGVGWGVWCQGWAGLGLCCCGGA